MLACGAAHWPRRQLQAWHASVLPQNAEHTHSPISPPETAAPRCQNKYEEMVSGGYPANVPNVDTSVEPLAYWLPRVLGAVPVMQPAARKALSIA